jgi:hypothetical protein
MSRSVYAAIVGNGKTTRSNVEALLGDYSEAVSELNLVVETLAESPDTPISEGAIWASQYATDAGLTVHYTTDIYSHIQGVIGLGLYDVRLFLLWDDDDVACQTAVAFAQEHSLSVFDLTDGLVQVPTDGAKVDPPSVSEMPASETNVKEELPDPISPRFMPFHRDSIFEAEQEPVLLWDDDDFLEMEGGELIEAALQEAGKLMARAFVTEMLSILKASKDDDKAE